MILKSLKTFSQNIHKNRLLTNTILENNKNFNIIFIQESLWSIIYNIPSSISEEGEVIVRAFYYLLWMLFTRLLHIENDYPRVLTYINIKLIRLHFLFRKDIFNYKNINLIFFFNWGVICFIINIYSDNQQSILKYLKNTEVNLNNILIMTGDFNIRDNKWDISYLYHLIHTDTLRKIANSFNLELSLPINQVST